MRKTVFYILNDKLKFVEFKLTGRYCEKIREKTFSWEGRSFNAQELKSFLRKENFQNTRLVGGMFRHQVVVRFFVFPSHDETELARMVKYEAADLLPLKSEDTVTRHMVLNRRPNGYSDVLVIVVHKEEIAKVAELFSEQSLEIEGIHLSTFGLLSCARRYFFRKNKSEKTSVMLVHFEGDAVEILIAWNGVLRLSRGFMIDNSINISQVLLSEVRHSIELLSEQNRSRKMDKIVVSGSRNDLPDFVSILQSHFDVPVMLEKRVDVSAGIVDAGSAQPNMLSDDFLLRRITGRMKKSLIWTAGLLLLNLLLVIGIFSVSLKNRDDYASRLRSLVEELKPQAQSVQNKLEKLKVFQSQLSSRMLILDSLTDLVKVVSPDCSLNMISINEEGVLIVRGEAPELQKILDLVVEIEKSAYFKNSRLNYSSRRKLRDKQVLDFEIQADLDQEQ